MEIVIITFYLALVVFLVAAQWKVYTKASQPGWACLVPIYNVYVLTKIAKKPGWWVLMILLIPVANIIFAIMLIHGVSKSFGKGSGFTVGLIFLGIVFWPLLGFGDAEYIDNDGIGRDDAVLDENVV